jgi:phosphatidylglycerophosphate synthase
MTSPTSRTPGPASPASSAPRSAKPLEAEELVDEHVHRPLARLLIPGLARTAITPNQVTFLSGLIGVIGGILLGMGAHRPGLLPWSGILLFVSVVLDCCDGQLARIRGISSTTGAVVDGLADYAVGLAMGIGASYYMVTVHANPWLWLLGIAGIVSAAAQSWYFDHAKTRYIARIRTGYAEREEDLDKIVAQRKEALSRKQYWDALLLFGYLNYSRAQNAALAIELTEEPAQYRARHAGRMRAWTWLGTGSHFALAYLACFAAIWWPDAIMAYFALHLVPLNLYLLALIALEPRARAT